MVYDSNKNGFHKGNHYTRRNGYEKRKTNETELEINDFNSGAFEIIQCDLDENPSLFKDHNMRVFTSDSSYMAVEDHAFYLALQGLAKAHIEKCHWLIGVKIWKYNELMHSEYPISLALESYVFIRLVANSRIKDKHKNILYRKHEQIFSIPVCFPTSRHIHVHDGVFMPDDFGTFYPKIDDYCAHIGQAHMEMVIDHLSGKSVLNNLEMKTLRGFNEILGTLT